LIDEFWLLAIPPVQPTALLFSFWFILDGINMGSIDEEEFIVSLMLKGGSTI